MTPLDAERLRWSCPPEWLDFSGTADLEVADGMVGQDSAVDALRFGLRIEGHGQHVFVRAHPASGRVTFVRSVIAATELPGGPEPDRCFVHNFDRPDSPRLISLPTGQGPEFERRVTEMIRFVADDLPDLLGSDRVLGAKREVEQQAAAQLKEISAPFDSALAEAGLAVVQIEGEEDGEPLVVPVIDGEPQPFEHLDALSEAGGLDPAVVQQMRERARTFTAELRRMSAQAIRIQKRTERTVSELLSREVADLLGDAVADLRRSFPPAVDWLDDVIVDVSKHIPLFAAAPALLARYRVNVLSTRRPEAATPIELENLPTLQRLLGGVDPVMDESLSAAPHLGIHCGSLLRNAGGVVIIHAREVFEEPGAWAALKRVLRTGEVELTPAEHHASTVRFAGIKPDPVPLRVKVVLLGDPTAYAFLEQNDNEFERLFKVLVDLSDVLPRDRRGVRIYGRVVARLVQRDGLLPFDAQAIAALAEHGARVVAEEGRLTARMGRIADIAREAAYHATERSAPAVHREDVEHAVLAGKRRADRPGRRFRERVKAGIRKVWITGRVVGQVNGLAVIAAGPLNYGFPTRVTATVGPGKTGAINIEREAQLSGAIHTKGFLILGGLLRHLLRTEHPLIFDASLTHEQSYGGIDGDSASGAEFVCLLSALTETPVRQGIAMTGAIDQLGNILPIGAVNEKIEGFFDLCAHLGLDGTQGVIIPASNVGDLQLRRDVVEACRAGRFAVWPVDDICEALAHFTGEGAEAVLQRAVARAEVLWKAAIAEGA